MWAAQNSVSTLKGLWHGLPQYLAKCKGLFIICLIFGTARMKQATMPFLFVLGPPIYTICNLLKKSLTENLVTNVKNAIYFREPKFKHSQFSNHAISWHDPYKQANNYCIQGSVLIKTLYHIVVLHPIWTLSTILLTMLSQLVTFNNRWFSST